MFRITFLFVVVSIAALLPAGATERLRLPDELQMGGRPVTTGDGAPLDLGLVVSIAPVDAKHSLICNYQAIYVFDHSTGEARELPKPDNVSAWYPTGLEYNPSTRRLYVANYLGKDILVLTLAEDLTGLSLSRRITDPELLGPENISVTPDESMIVAADYDGSAVIAFDRNGSKLWRTPLGNAHGVSIDPHREFVYASGLTPAGVAKYDYSGKQLAAVFSSGWGENQYFWPTGVSVTPDGSVLVSDAHLGRIKKLTPELKEIGTLGGNGAAPSLFNMPYGVRSLPTGTALVTDTFKSRILRVDFDTGGVTEAWRGTTPIPPSAESIARPSSLAAWHDTPSFGAGYVGRVGTSQTFAIHGLPGIEGIKWHPAYGTLYAEDGGTIGRLYGAMGLFTGSLFYWTQAKETTVNGRHYTILGSPQAPTWIALRDGFPLRLNLKRDLWVSESGLMAGTGEIYPYDELIGRAEEVAANFRAAVRNGDPLKDALCRYYLGACESAYVRANIAALAQTTAGKALTSAIVEGATLADATPLALAVDGQSPQGAEMVVYLPELFLRNLIIQAAE